jgi:hypothetical protein
MAKKPPYIPSAAPADEEMVVTVVKFRGSGESLRRGIDALSQALSGAFGAPPVKQIGNGRKAATHLPATTEQSPIDIEPADVPDGEPAEEPELQPTVSPRPKKAIKYSFLPELNLAPNGAPSLKAFCSGKTADGEQAKYLLVSLWLQKHGGVDPFGGNEVFTCFRGLDWTPRKDVMQPVREMKSKKSWYDSPAYGKYRLTQPGIEAAEAVV